MYALYHILSWFTIGWFCHDVWFWHVFAEFWHRLHWLKTPGLMPSTSNVRFRLHPNAQTLAIYDNHGFDQCKFNTERRLPQWVIAEWHRSELNWSQLVNCMQSTTAGKAARKKRLSIYWQDAVYRLVIPISWAASGVCAVVQISPSKRQSGIVDRDTLLCKLQVLAWSRHAIVKTAAYSDHLGFTQCWGHQRSLMP